jgi:guanyl-specific ribonuclease Sa
MKLQPRRSHPFLSLLIIAVVLGVAHHFGALQYFVEQTLGSATASTYQTARNDAQYSPAPGQAGFLPPEAIDTIREIQSGGPFPYARDGIVFSNYERVLPIEPRGYYHEYTVITPGASNRGARRIVTGGAPPEVWYYTDDHYETFREFFPPGE